MWWTNISASVPPVLPKLSTKQKCNITSFKPDLIRFSWSPFLYPFIFLCTFPYWVDKMFEPVVLTQKLSEFKLCTLLQIFIIGFYIGKLNILAVTYTIKILGV